MPPNSTLLKIYDKITIGKCSYCFLCFRTDSESKLKIPQSYLKSTTSLSTLGNISNKPPRICYMCETLALAAAKFRKATFFATSIDMLFKSMTLSSKYQTEVRKLLDREGPIDPVEFNEHRTLFIDEQELTAYRKNMQLQRTEVVVIDSNDVFTNDPNTTIKTLGDSYKVTQPSTTTIDISEDTNSCDMNLETTVTKPTEDVIVLDDDQPQHTKTRTRSSEQVPNQIMHKKAKIKEKTHQEMKDRPILVPIDKLMQKQEATVGFLHAILQNPDGTRVVPSLSAQIVNGQLVFQNQETPQPLVDNTVIIPITNKVTEETSKNSAEVVSESDKAIMDVQAAVDKIVVDRLEDIKRKRLGGLKGQQMAQVVVDSENKVVKEPLMKTDRIDWEDKIPMDVISFMDATDPNPPSYIKPLLPSGVISDVRSLKEIPESQCKEEVIDLC